MPVARKVVKVDRNFKVVAKYASLSEAAKAERTNVEKIWIRCNRCVFEEFERNGYTYRYADDPDIRRLPYIRVGKGRFRNKPVVKLDENGKIIGRFDSIKQAAEESFLSPSAVSMRCGTKADPGNLGFTFRYAEELT